MRPFCQPPTLRATRATPNLSRKLSPQRRATRPDLAVRGGHACASLRGPAYRIAPLTTGLSRALARQTNEVLTCLTFDSKVKIDEIVDKAVAAGASERQGELTDNDSVYMRSFDDLDGHIWEMMWMDRKGVTTA